MRTARGAAIIRAKQLAAEKGSEIRDRYESGETLAEVGAAYGIALSTVRVIVRRAGGATRKRGFGSRSIIGPRNPAWRGGRHFNEGYWRVWITEDHPLAAMRNHRGYLPEHRLVMAEALGRPLGSNETVHHINGDRADNRLGNLQLRQGKHGSGAHFSCLDCGSVNVQAQPLK